MYSMESRLRTFVRSLTWRFFGVILAVLLTWYYTGSLELGIELGIAYNVIRLATHYFHDRFWATIPWGMIHREGPPSDEPALGEPSKPVTAAEGHRADGPPRSDDLEPIIAEWASD